MKQIITVLILGLFSLIIGIAGYQEVNPSALLIYHDGVRVASGPILPGHPVTGEFVAHADNLGIVKLRIRTFNRLNTSHLMFRLRQKGTAAWLVENRYTVDRFPNGLLYPFGFPPITGSGGRTYEFEVSSPDATQTDAVGIWTGYHDIASLYVNQGLREKIITSILDPFTVLYISMFLIPAFIFLFRGSSLVVMTGLAYQAFVFTYVPVSVYSNIALFIGATGLFAAYLSGVRARAVFIAGLIALVQIPFTLGAGNTLAADRLATLIFFSLVLGVMMAVREL